MAKRLRELREARGLSQAALAGSDFTKGYVSQLETGRVGLSLRAANAFAERLGVSVSDLLRTPDEAERVAELALIEAERELAQGSPERALSLARRIREGSQRGRALRLQGRSLLALDRAAEALPVLEKAREAFRGSGDVDSAIRTLRDVAYAHARLDRPEQALALLLQCEQALRGGDLVDRTLELEVESFLASTYARMGNPTGAEPHLERALAMAEDVVSHDALAALYGRLATVEQQNGRFDRALEMWRKTLKELETLGRERQVADTWHNIAVAYLRLRAYDKARSALSRAEELQLSTSHERLKPWLTLTRARLALEERRLAEAESLATEASMHSGDVTIVRGEALLLLGQVLSRKHAPLARIRERFELALRQFANEPVGVRARALKLYADALDAAGDQAAAFRRSREALELLRPG